MTTFALPPAAWLSATPGSVLPWALVLALLGFILWREWRARRVAERMRAAEARLQAAIESMPFEFWAMDADGRYSLLNSAAIAQWGDQQGKRPEDLDLPAETLARWQENNRRAFQGQIVRAELTFRQNGHARIVEHIVAPIRDRDAVRGILGVNIDITERKHAAKALRQSELRFRALLEHSTDAVALLDATARILYASSSCERILGYPVAEVLGRNVFDFVHPEDQAAVELQLREAVAHPARAVPVRARLRHADGAWRLLGGTYTDLLGDPAVAGIVCNFRDITEPTAAERALRDSEARVQAFMDHSPAVIFMKDTELRYVQVNRRFERVFGLRRGEILGRTDAEIFAPEQARRFMENDRRALAENRAIEFEETAQYCDGTHTSIVLKFPLRDAAGVVTGICGLATDITERRHMEEQLREAQRMESIGQLAGGVAHDFNNLLTVIQGHASLIEVVPELSAEVAESVQQISLAAERAANLTRQLLAFSRRQFLLPRPIALNEVVGEMTRMLRRVLGEDIVLQFQPGPGLPTVHADPGMIEHVLVNLALNARDAMPRGGRLVVATDHRHFELAQIPIGASATSGVFVRLRVSDTGCGIAPEHLPRIFEPFFTTKGVGKGSGLGLATVYGIVQQHHGWIDVASTPGAGSSFEIYLPATPAPAPSASHPAAAALADSSESGKVIS